MFYSKSKEKIYACECKVEKEFLKKSKLKNFKILYAFRKGRNIVRSFVNTPLFLHPPGGGAFVIIRSSSPKPTMNDFAKLEKVTLIFSFTFCWKM